MPRAELFIEGEITDESPTKLKSQLDAIGAGAPLDLHINSSGGLVFAGVSMANMIARHKGHTRAFNDGLTASIATQIYFSADECFAPTNSFFLLHRPSTETQGNSVDHIKAAETLDRLQRGLETTYQKKARAGVTTADIRAMVDAETWLTGTEAASIFQITLLDPVAAFNLAGNIERLKSQGINIPPMLNQERNVTKMRRSDELRKQIREQEYEVERAKRESRHNDWAHGESMLRALNEALETAIRNEEETMKTFQSFFTPQNYTAVAGAGSASAADMAALRNRAFNKLLFAKVKGEPPRLTDEEQAAYYNVSGSPGSPGQIEAVPARGGYVVSQEQLNTLQEFRSAFVALKDHATVMQAGSSYGRWPTLPDQSIEFQPLVEMTDIAESEITFDELEYKIDDYALIIPCSNQLLDDADIDLVSVIGRQLAKGAVRTENRQILEPLTTLLSTATTVTTYKALNVALYRTLDGSFEPTAKIFCNQDSFLWLSNLEDAQNRPLLVPDVTAPSTYLYRGKPIVVVPNSILPNRTVGGNNFAPIFCGDMSSYIYFFERKGLELSTSSEYLWRKNAFAVRAILRFDVVVADPRALIALQVAV